MAVDEVKNPSSSVTAGAASVAKFALIPHGWEKLNREVIQRELEVEGKAKDSMIVRANTILAGAGVVLGMLINAASKDTTTALSLLISSAMVLSLIAALCALSVQLIRSEATQLAEENLLAESAIARHTKALESNPDRDGIGDYELFISATYYEVLMAIRQGKDKKATYLKAAQVLYATSILLLLVTGLLK